MRDPLEIQPLRIRDVELPSEERGPKIIIPENLESNYDRTIASDEYVQSQVSPEESTLLSNYYGNIGEPQEPSYFPTSEQIYRTQNPQSPSNNYMGLQYPASGTAEYFPLEAMIGLPGTPAVKGLGKVGNFLLDAVNPIAGMGKNPTGKGAKEIFTDPKMSNAEWMEKALSHEKNWDIGDLTTEKQMWDLIDMEKVSYFPHENSAINDLISKGINQKDGFPNLGDFKFKSGKGKELTESMAAFAEFGNIKHPGNLSFNTPTNIKIREFGEEFTELVNRLRKKNKEMGFKEASNAAIESMIKSGKYTEKEIAENSVKLLSENAKNTLKKPADWELLKDNGRSEFFPELAGKNYPVDKMGVQGESGMDPMLWRELREQYTDLQRESFQRQGMLDYPEMNAEFAKKNKIAQDEYNKMLGGYFTPYQLQARTPTGKPVKPAKLIGEKGPLTLNSMYNPKGIHWQPYTGKDAFKTFNPNKYGGTLSKHKFGLSSNINTSMSNNISNFETTNNTMMNKLPQHKFDPNVINEWANSPERNYDDIFGNINSAYTTGQSLNDLNRANRASSTYGGMNGGTNGGLLGFFNPEMQKNRQENRRNFLRNTPLGRLLLGSPNEQKPNPQNNNYNANNYNANNYFPQPNKTYKHYTPEMYASAGMRPQQRMAYGGSMLPQHGMFGNMGQNPGFQAQNPFSMPGIIQNGLSGLSQISGGTGFQNPQNPQNPNTNVNNTDPNTIPPPIPPPIMGGMTNNNAPGAGYKTTHDAYYRNGGKMLPRGGFGDWFNEKGAQFNNWAQETGAAANNGIFNGLNNANNAANNANTSINNGINNAGTAINNGINTAGATASNAGNTAGTIAANGMNNFTNATNSFANGVNSVGINGTPFSTGINTPNTGGNNYSPFSGGSNGQNSGGGNFPTPVRDGLNNIRNNGREIFSNTFPRWSNFLYGDNNQNNQNNQPGGETNWDDYWTAFHQNNPNAYSNTQSPMANQGFTGNNSWNQYSNQGGPTGGYNGQGQQPYNMNYYKYGSGDMRTTDLMARDIANKELEGNELVLTTAGNEPFMPTNPKDKKEEIFSNSIATLEKLKGPKHKDMTANTQGGIPGIGGDGSKAYSIHTNVGKEAVNYANSLLPKGAKLFT